MRFQRRARVLQRKVHVIAFQVPAFFDNDPVTSCSDQHDDEAEEEAKHGYGFSLSREEPGGVVALNHEYKVGVVFPDSPGMIA